MFEELPKSASGKAGTLIAEVATNLHELGIPDKVIQAILRHEDVKTTQRSYIKTVPSVVTEKFPELRKDIAPKM